MCLCMDVKYDILLCAGVDTDYDASSDYSGSDFANILILEDWINGRNGKCIDCALIAVQLLIFNADVPVAKIKNTVLNVLTIMSNQQKKITQLEAQNAVMVDAFIQTMKMANSFSEYVQ